MSEKRQQDNCKNMVLSLICGSSPISISELIADYYSDRYKINDEKNLEDWDGTIIEITDKENINTKYI